MADELKIPIESESDIVTARRRGRDLAARLGFPATDQISIATAIADLARNILERAQRGEILLSSVHVKDNHRLGFQAIAREMRPAGPQFLLERKGAPSPGGDLLLRLSTTRRTMDEFEIKAAPGKETSVTIRKWMR